MRIQPMRYKFVECECNDSVGRLVKIPAGVWDVGELDIVSVYIDGNRVIDLFLSVFQHLKRDGKAIIVS